MTIAENAAPVRGLVVSGPEGPRYAEVLTTPALEFLAALHRQFDVQRLDLLSERFARQARFDRGELPDFRPETKAIREADWTVAEMPAEIADRRVELAGPVDRLTLLRGLNSGARTFMADFEDSLAPTFANLIEGQINLLDRWLGDLTATDPATGTALRLVERPAVLMMRPRGLHLPEAHIVVDGEEMSGALVDFGLAVFHGAARAVAAGSRPYFYLPKLEGHLEARWWNQVFAFTEDRLELPRGTIRATVHIETLPAAFEMDEIIYELRDHMAGLNCGRWDYIFSLLKTFRSTPAYLLPDRSQVDMGDAFLKAYSDLLIKTCHRRGTFAIGGMSAFIPDGADPLLKDRAMAEIKADKEREAKAGHDGTWVIHPALIPVAREAFDRFMPGPNQLGVRREDVTPTQDDLLEVHDGIRTPGGFRDNVRTSVTYLEGWLSGRGAVPIDHIVEDASLAEISRAQVWQQLRFRASLADGRRATPQFLDQCLKEEMAKVEEEIGADAYNAGRFPEAVALFRSLSLAETLEPFMTLAAYRMIA
ncbi:MAG: malate synthase A [Bauldia sp.]